MVWWWREHFKCNTSLLGSTVRTYHCVYFNFAARMRDSAPINEFERRRWQNINHVVCYIFLYISPFGISQQACILLWIINSMTYPCFNSYRQTRRRNGGGSSFSCKGFCAPEWIVCCWRVWQNRTDNSRWDGRTRTLPVCSSPIRRINVNWCDLWI